MHEPLVIGLVINWNGMSIEYEAKPILRTCLQTLVRTDYRNLRIVLVDGQSADNSVEFARSNFTMDTLSTENKGFAYNCNEGILYAFKKYPDLKYVLLLNNDLIIKDRKWLRKLIDSAEGDNKVGVVGCRLLYPNGSIQHGSHYLSVLGIPANYNVEKPSGYVFAVTGACFLIKREVLEKIGLLDEIYIPIYAEDTDFCERVRRAGYKVYYRNDTDIFHLEGYSVIKDNRLEKKWSSKAMSFALQRNILIYLLRYHKKKCITVLFYRMFQGFLEKRSRGYTFARELRKIRESFTMPMKQLRSALRMYKNSIIRVVHER